MAAPSPRKSSAAAASSSPASGSPARASASGAPPGPRPPAPQLSPMAPKGPASPPLALSPMGGGAGVPAAAAPARPGLSPFRFSQGHGAYSEKGGLKKNKTEIRPSAVASVNEQRSKAISGGKTRRGGGDLDVSFVPRKSAPSQFRAIATKTGGGGDGGVTSFPLGLDVSPAMLAKAGLRPEQLVHEPQSPRGASAAAASGSAVAPAEHKEPS